MLLLLRVECGVAGVNAPEEVALRSEVLRVTMRLLLSLDELS